MAGKQCAPKRGGSPEALPGQKACCGGGCRKRLPYENGQWRRKKSGLGQLLRGQGFLAGNDLIDFQRVTFSSLGCDFQIAARA